MNEVKNKDKKINFEIEKLSEINFGKLEGERDPLLEDCFFPTKSVQKFLNGEYNYVLSPKGAGKSALFRAISNNYLASYPNLFLSENFSVVSINEAFGFDDDYLNQEKFKNDKRIELTISWALYILSKLIYDIITNHKDKKNYDKFLTQISKVTELKDKFNLYNLSDILKSFEAEIQFMANGQEFSVSPKIKKTEKEKKIILNSHFKEIDSFYKINNLKALIIIDRLDNFVQKEEYHTQRKYIQGLIDCVEEISLLKNIIPTVFLRTDLFYSYESDIEYDKIKDRAIELKWENGETLNFLVNRFLYDKFIYENFKDSLFEYIKDGNEGKLIEFVKPKNIIQKIILFFSKNKSNQLDTTKPLNYTVSNKFLKIFFPEYIEINEKEEFCHWIFNNLKDANGFINPRLLIYFFNTLMDKQYHYYNEFFPQIEHIKPNNNSTDIRYTIFNNDVFKSTFDKIKQDELMNIYLLLKKKSYQNLFKIINEKNHITGTFRYGDISLKNLDIEKEEFDSLLKYLKLLGYCQESEKQKYLIPRIYQAKLIER